MALSLQEIQELLKEVPQWYFIDGHIERNFLFVTFLESIGFVNQVAEIAEEMGHHPDIDIRYTSVKLVLVTHDEGGLSNNDFEAAKRIDHI